jgi:hypothetical protein
LWKYLEASDAMANPNPSPSTRFGAPDGNSPRAKQKGARDKISTAFLEALNDAFNEPNGEGGTKGLDAVKKVRDDDPATFARIFAALMPKQLEIEDTSPESKLTDQQLEDLYNEMLMRLAAKAEKAEKANESPEQKTVN